MLENISPKNSGAKKRRERERNGLRLRIIEAARELFARAGESGVTLRNVAEKIEYSATAIYSHFPSKEALMQELCDAEFAHLSHALQKAAQTSDPRDRLRKTALAYVDFGLQHPKQYRFLFLRDAAVSDTLAKPPAANPSHSPDPLEISHSYGHLQAAVFKAMAAGWFKPEYRNVELIAQSLWSCLHGLVTLHLVRAQHSSVTWEPVQGTLELTLESLLNGLAALPHQSPPTWIR